MTPTSCQKDGEKHTGPINNSVGRISFYKEHVPLLPRCRLTQIKAAVIWSNICIFLPFFIVIFFFFNHMCSCTHTHTLKNEGRKANTYAQSQTHALSAAGSLLTLRAAGDGTCPLKGSKGQGPECKGHCLITVATSLSGGKFPPVWGY